MHWNLWSQISLCLKAASAFLLDVNEATKLIASHVKTIKSFWPQLCDEAALSEVDRNLMWRRQFLNPFAFIGAPDEIVALAG